MSRIRKGSTNNLLLPGVHQKRDEKQFLQFKKHGKVMCKNTTAEKWRTSFVNNISEKVVNRDSRLSSSH